MSVEGEKVLKKITIVDEHDTVIGYKNLPEALAAGDTRRVCAVYVFNSVGELLLQKRADWVINPNCWDHSAGGHVDEGSTYQSAADLELLEELGLTIDLTEVATSVFHDNLYWGIYKGVLDDVTDVSFDAHEVSDVRFIALDDLKREMDEHPKHFNPTFLSLWPKIRDKIMTA